MILNINNYLINKFSIHFFITLVLSIVISTQSFGQSIAKKQQILTNSKWTYFDSFVHKKGSKSSVIQDCEKDNWFYFQKDRLIISEGATLCNKDESNEPISCKWFLADEGKTLVFDFSSMVIEFKIIQITEKKLILRDDKLEIVLKTSNK